MAPANSLEINEIEMEMVPEKYMDAITCEFSYDPVRLPLDQDASQSLYNRKTIETIWETKCQADNPFTKQWFNVKSVIPQTELRQEMEDYIKLQKSSACRSAELDVIEEYSKILEEEDMKQYLDLLFKSMPEQVTTQKQCSMLWKKINVLRLYCQFHSKNIETFRSLHGFRYLNEVITQITMLLINRNIVENSTRETAWDVCKEIARAIDVIGLKPLDIYDIESCPNWKYKQTVLIWAYMQMIDHVYIFKESYMKLESLMIRMFCKIFDEMGAQIEQILGKELYESIVIVMGFVIGIRKLFQTDAKDISSEDLRHGISIMRRTWMITSSFDDPLRSQILVNAIILCIAREIERLEEMRGLSEAQLLETEAEGRHNSEALEMGLCLVKDILMTEGPSAGYILQGGLYVVEEILRMFEHFTRQDESEDETSGRDFVSICVKKGCKIFECIHSRIAQLGLDINTAISRIGGGPPFDTKLLLQFVKSGSTVSGST